MPTFEYQIVSTRHDGRERSAITIALDLNRLGTQGFTVIDFDMYRGRYTLCREVMPRYEYETVAPMEMNLYTRVGWEFVAVIPAGADIHFTQYLIRREDREPVTPAAEDCAAREYRRMREAVMRGFADDVSTPDDAPVAEDVEDAEILQDEP